MVTIDGDHQSHQKLQLMALKFITGNKNKFAEMQFLLAPIEIERVEVDLEEIQELDPKKIIEHKLKEAFEHESAEFIVEDTSLYLEALNDQLPGPLVKWFNETIGNDGLFAIADRFNNYAARTSTLIGYAKDSDHIEYFEGEVKGVLIQPKEPGTFGYDPTFSPEDTGKSLSDLKKENNFEYSGRGRAAKKLKEFLLQKN